MRDTITIQHPRITEQFNSADIHSTHKNCTPAFVGLQEYQVTDSYSVLGYIASWMIPLIHLTPMLAWHLLVYSSQNPVFPLLAGAFCY